MFWNDLKTGKTPSLELAEDALLRLGAKRKNISHKKTGQTLRGLIVGFKYITSSPKL